MKKKRLPFVPQLTEIDCVPATFLNALNKLFTRGEIPAIVIQRIYQDCLDLPNNKGTSTAAVQCLGIWLSQYRDPKMKAFKVGTEFCIGEEVHFNRRSKITRRLTSGGVALLQLWDRDGDLHYVLVLSADNDWVHCFDPYYEWEPRMSKQGGYEFIQNPSFHGHNLKINRAWLDGYSEGGGYRLGHNKDRECLLMWRKRPAQ